jgi:hypothetical protein
VKFGGGVVGVEFEGEVEDEVEVARELRLGTTESRQLDRASSRFWRKKTAPSGALALRGAFRPGLVESHRCDAAAGNEADGDAAARMPRLDSS